MSCIHPGTRVGSIQLSIAIECCWCLFHAQSSKWSPGCWRLSFPREIFYYCRYAKQWSLRPTCS
ncbi:unnamed protein product [Periconia digitata]|uniref:Uncharacterized protein n=1 Tax=Periconia digitata TaxID=1303443 RepID=A0A9W4UCR6_9PLEO|nr:unnamed protein product [Periconia digitata]